MGRPEGFSLGPLKGLHLTRRKALPSGTVRALHYYEEIGLLVPSGRSAAGHRLYDTADVARLYRISLLRRLGFPLDQVMSVLDDPQWELAAAVSRHLGETRRRASSAARLSAQPGTPRGARTGRSGPGPR